MDHPIGTFLVYNDKTRIGHCADKHLQIFVKFQNFNLPGSPEYNLVCLTGCVPSSNRDCHIKDALWI